MKIQRRLYVYFKFKLIKLIRPILFGILLLLKRKHGLKILVIRIMPPVLLYKLRRIAQGTTNTIQINITNNPDILRMLEIVKEFK